MEYNNYYPGQSGHSSPNLANHQHTGPQMQQQAPPQTPTSMIHPTMPTQNIRQTISSGPHNQHQQIQHQQQQVIGQHPQHSMPPQQHHAHYHQIQPSQSQHGPPVSHSSSPHGQHQSDQNLQPSLNGPPPQSAVQSQQHHVHPQSPYHHSGPHMHIQQQQQQQQPPQPQQQPLNHMVRSSLGPSVINHPHIGLQQPINHHQSFFSGPMPQSSSVHHFPQQNQHHAINPFQHHHHHHQAVMHHSHPPMGLHHHHHHHPPPPPPPHIQQQGLGRNSPYYPGILQTEFRVIELNRRLQSRPMQRYPISPLPNLGNPFDEGAWWERFASEFFEDNATLTLRMQEDKPVEFTIGRTLIPKFFRTYFDGGVTDLSINLRNPKETCTHPHIITLDCDQAFIVTHNIYKHPAVTSNQGVVVHTEGRLVLEFVNNIDALSIKSWKFYTKGCREYIDRSVIALGLPNAFLVEPITRQGLTKSTVSYLKMCMIMEPMQDIIVLHRHTKLDPRSCMQKLLVDRYKFRIGDDGRAATNKRRKRKPSTAPTISGPTTGRKSKANMATMANIANNNTSLSNNMLVAPNNAPSFSLASQDVMVVGEPSMMGGDFGDDNERMITRLENTQYDPSATAPPNTKIHEGMNTLTGNNNSMSNGNIVIDPDSISAASSLLQNRGQQPHPNQSMQSGQQLPHQPREPLSQESMSVEHQDLIETGIAESLDQSQVHETEQQQQQQQQADEHQQLSHPDQPPQPQQQAHISSHQRYQDQHEQHSPERQLQQQPPLTLQLEPPQQSQQPQIEPQEQQPQANQQQSPEIKIKKESDIQTQPQEQLQEGSNVDFNEGSDFNETNHKIHQNQDHSVRTEEDREQVKLEPNLLPSQSDSQTSFPQSKQVEEQPFHSEVDQNQTIVEKTVEKGNVDQEQRLNEQGEKERDAHTAVKESPKIQVLEVNSVTPIEMNHTNSVQTSNEESNSNSSQLPCAQSTTGTAREQTQPMDNGVA